MTLFKTSKAAFVVAALMTTGTFAGTSLMLAEPAAAQAAGGGKGGGGGAARCRQSELHHRKLPPSGTGPHRRQASAPQLRQRRGRDRTDTGRMACPARVQSPPDLNGRGGEPDAGCQMPPFTPEGGIISSGTKKSAASGFDGSTR